MSDILAELQAVVAEVQRTVYCHPSEADRIAVALTDKPYVTVVANANVPAGQAYISKVLPL